MSLIAIKQHMIKVKKATLSSLCVLFNADAEQLRCLLQHWMRKGKIRQCTMQPACGTQCAKCPTAMREMYEWIAV